LYYKLKIRTLVPVLEIFSYHFLKGIAQNISIIVAGGEYLIMYLFCMKYNHCEEFYPNIYFSLWII